MKLKTLSIFLMTIVTKPLVAQQLLDTVQIQSTPKQSMRASMPEQTLSGSALHRLNAFSIADALRYFSGIQIKDYGGIGGLKTVNVRDLGANHTTVFYNGVPIGNAQNGQVDLGKFSLDNIEAVSLYNGGIVDLLQPASAYASGATIYLETKKPHFQADEKQHLQLGFQTGSFGLWTPSILFQQKLSKPWLLQISGAHIGANGRYKFQEKVVGGYDTSAIRHNADIRSDRWEASLFGNLNRQAQWQSHLYYYQSERGLPGAIVSNRLQNPQRLWNKDIFFQNQFTQKINDFYQLKAIGKFEHHYTHYFDPTTVGVDGALNNYYRENDVFLSLSNVFQLHPSWQAQIAGDYIYNHLNANLDNFAYPSRNTFLWNAALQLHKNRWNANANVLGTFISNKVQFGEKPQNSQKVTPTLSFNWQPSNGSPIHIRGFYKNIFRMPTFNDLYYTTIGTVNLKPEFAKQWDLGMTFLHAFAEDKISLSGQIDGFYNRIKNKIIALPAQNLFRWKMMNLGNVESLGINTSIASNWQIATNNKLNIKLQYSFEKSTNKTKNNSSYGSPIPYTPRNSGTAIVNWEYFNWQLNYSFIYTGERYNVADKQLPDSKLQPWYTHDLGLGRNWKIAKNLIGLQFEMLNIWNQQYDVIQNYPMPGRNYRIKISYHI